MEAGQNTYKSYFVIYVNQKSVVVWTGLKASTEGFLKNTTVNNVILRWNPSLLLILYFTN